MGDYFYKPDSKINLFCLHFGKGKFNSFENKISSVYNLEKENLILLKINFFLSKFGKGKFNSFENKISSVCILEKENLILFKIK
jgi:hypothetical protein